MVHVYYLYLSEYYFYKDIIILKIMIQINLNFIYMNISIFFQLQII